MSLSYGSVYDFTPTAFVLPNEYLRFVLEYSRGRDTPRNVWICKPTDQSRGRGITVFRELHELSYSTCAIVQRYLCNSLLISGYKFDLRLYACVLSFRPLTIYVYRDGLVRFATEPFDLRSLQNTFSHITNSSINKFSPAYDEGKGSVGLGCKWTIRQLRHYFANIDVPDWCLWQRIGHIILLTLLCEAPLVSSNNNTFELYGFDIIIDETFTPWLLEVNRHPSLGMDCDVDVVVKKPLLHDLMDLMTIEDSMTTFHLQTPDSKIENSIPPLGSRPTSAKMKSSKGNTASKRRICGARRGPSPSAVTAKVSPASGSWKRWSDPPLSVGGFLKVFPTGNKSWKCPSHTRAVVHYIRQLERLFLKVSRNAKRHCQGRIMEDEDYQKALQDLMGTEDVLFWTPRQ